MAGYTLKKSETEQSGRLYAEKSETEQSGRLYTENSGAKWQAIR